MTNEQLFELLNVGLIVGGSIVIPHLRRAWSCWMNSMPELQRVRRNNRAEPGRPRGGDQGI